MITVSTTSPGETRDVTDLFRKAPAHLDWQIYHLSTQPVAASADMRTWTKPDNAIRPESLHPGHERMRELLIARGQKGYATWRLWDLLRGEDLDVARETLQRWLRKDANAGLVICRGGRVSGWVWAGDAR